MNRNNLILAALVIFVVGAVLFVVNLAPGSSDDELANDTLDIQVENTIPQMEDLIASKEEPDSIVHLEKTGYSIVLPHGYEINDVINDSSFVIVPKERSEDCIELIVEFQSRREWPVIGRRPTSRIDANILGKSCTFREYQPYGLACGWLSGGVGLPQGSVIINCHAPKGDEMNRLFAIATSLQKTD